MNIFTRLPIVLPGNLFPTIPESEIEYFTDYEMTAYDHWIFNRGSAVDLVGRKAGKTLVAQSTAPTYSGNYLSMLNSVGKGLLTDMLEPVNASLTICAVVRDPNAGAPTVRTPFGTLDTTGAGGSGGMPLSKG